MSKLKIVSGVDLTAEYVQDLTSASTARQFDLGAHIKQVHATSTVLADDEYVLASWEREGMAFLPAEAVHFQVDAAAESSAAHLTGRVHCWLWDFEFIERELLLRRINSKLTAMPYLKAKRMPENWLETRAMVTYLADMLPVTSAYFKYKKNMRARTAIDQALVEVADLRQNLLNQQAW